MNLFLPLGVKYWPVLVKTFVGCFLVRKQSPHLMARILTNLLQKSLRNRLASQK
jgi:TRAP-type C4-dicarboxylate transport system permease small subunit